MARILRYRRSQLKTQNVFLLISAISILVLVTLKMTGSNPFMVIFIMSKEDNRINRDAIRNTWLKDSPDDVRAYFVIGLKSQPPGVVEHLDAENEEHGDLLLLPNLSDTYGTLTKKVLSSLEWAVDNFHFKFFMKTDDDSFVRLDALRRQAKKIDGDGVYWGFFDGRAPVMKDGNWAETAWVMCDTYVPYAKGGGYLLTRDLVKFITDNKDMMTSFSSEDVSIGAWLVPLRIRRLHDYRFDTEFRSRGCSNEYLVTHKVTSAHMRTLYGNLQRLGRLCENEVTVRYSYIYDWNEVPSKCCDRKLTDYGLIRNDW